MNIWLTINSIEVFILFKINFNFFLVLAFCAIPCQGNGVYNQGRCSCYLGWKGDECSVPSNKCTVPDCNGKGECDLNGECVCEAGYKGEDCSEGCLQKQK